MYKTTLKSMVRTGRRKTTNIDLAVEIAQKTGEPPVKYLSDKIKMIALEARPYLAEPLIKKDAK